LIIGVDQNIQLRKMSMRPILSEILTFRQHLETLSRAPEKYKPSNCPYCHSIKLWCHGYYPRKPDRIHIGYYSHNDLSVARFKCMKIVVELALR